MAAITVTRQEYGNSPRRMERWYGTSAANQADSLSTAVTPAVMRRLVLVTCFYSASPTQAGVTVTLDSGVGSTYDTVFTTGTANAQSTVYVPSNELIIMPDDIIKVDAPAGGSGITSRIVITTEIIPQ